MADTEQQQVTSKTPATKTPATKQKNPKRVAAGKAIAKKTREAREKQKKELLELRAKQAEASAEPSAESPAEPSAESTKNLITTTPVLTVIGIIVSLIGIYYKREELKGVLTKKDTPPPRAPAPSPVLPRALPSKIRKMD